MILIFAAGAITVNLTGLWLNLWAQPALIIALVFVAQFRYCQPRFSSYGENFNQDYP